jgi:hypothetical protein
MNIEDIQKKIAKMQFQIRTLGETVDHLQHPIESLILSMDWNEEDIDLAQDIFERYDTDLQAGKPVNWHAFEKELEHAFKIGYQTVKSIILAFWRNHQWTDVCHGYAMSFEPSTPVEFHQITRQTENQKS